MQKEPIYKIIKSETPEKKDYREVKPMDVARFEYGDYDNWVNAIILDIKIQETNYGGPKPVKEAVIQFMDTYGRQQTCYENVYNDKVTLDIIGRAIKNKKQKTKVQPKENEEGLAF